MKPIDQYLVECISAGKKPSGRRLKGHIYDGARLFCLAKNIEIPLCLHCGKKDSIFISISKGFGKYCSKQCYAATMGVRNTMTNRVTNVDRAVRKHEMRLDLYKDALVACEQEYAESDITVDELICKYKIPSYFLKQYFRTKKITTNKQVIVRKNNLLDGGFRKINQRLDDRDWVQDKLKGGWSCRNIANELGCSPNYVASYIRNTHTDIVFNNSASACEVDMGELLSTLGVQFVRRARDIIPPCELDIFIPKQDVAIEINGIYWHSSKHKDKQYHLSKTEKCNEQNIKLLHIYDSEINNKFDIVKSILKSTLGVVEQKIYARKCVVEPLTSAEYKKFCNINHIQGHARSSVRLGLFFNGVLVSVMGFAKPRFNKEYDYELIRLCSKLNTVVVGGASKLFTHFVKSYSEKSVISYCQRRLYSGNVYRQIGMAFSHTTPPNYFWVNSKNHILTRYQTQRHKLGVADTTQTEKDIMTNLNYHQIFDCGQSVFVYHPNSYK